jgi:hypothetical protein
MIIVRTAAAPGVLQALDELFPEGDELTNSLFVVRR